MDETLRRRGDGVWGLAEFCQWSLVQALGSGGSNLDSSASVRVQAP